MLRFFRVVVPLVVLSMLAAACAAGGDGGGGGSGQSEGQKTIVVTSLWGGSEQKAFEKMLAAFKQKTGITAKYESQRTDYAAVLRNRIAGGNPPDVAVIPGIGYLRGLVKDGLVKPLKDLGVERSAVEGNFASGTLDVGTVDNELYGVMVKLNSKSTVWYKPDSFKKQGFEVPATFDDLVKLTKDYKAKGEKTPWAVGAGSGDSWTLTDWFENIYLRQAGADKYDQLFSSKVPFTDPSVTQAITTMKQIINNDNIVGGVNGALGTGFVDSIGQVFGKNPKAELYYEGGFVGGIAIGQVNPKLKPGTDIDFFDFPAIGSGGEGTVTIGGDLAAAFTDKPGVAEFMKFLTSQEAGDSAATTGAFISPLKNVDLAKYPNELGKKEAEQVTKATTVKYDGADLLPAGPDFGAALQTALRGDPTKALKQFEQAVQEAWKTERGS
jgi:alpha-glucoside transport system substrate-binding protein